MARRLYSTAFWVFVAASSLLLFPLAVLVWAVTLPLDRRKLWLHRLTCLWAGLYTWLNPAWPVRIVGREKIRRDEAYVMVANHLSLLDILVLFRLFTHFKWVSKLENFRVPLIGWNMSLNGYIKLKRGDRESVRQMMRECERTLAGGSSIMMFPEGTRSFDGKLRPFKAGAFELALRSRRPILPLAIEGTGAALPRRGFVLRGRHPIRVTVLDELPVASFEHQSADELTERVRRIIAGHLGEKEPVPARGPA